MGRSEGDHSSAAQLGEDLHTPPTPSFLAVFSNPAAFLDVCT